MDTVRVMALGGKPPAFLTEIGGGRVDRGRWRLPPGSLARGVRAGSRIRVVERVYLPPTPWRWVRQAHGILGVLRRLPPQEGAALLPWLWEIWPTVRTGEDFLRLWEALLHHLGTPLPPCRRCGGSMLRGGDPRRWWCLRCGGGGEELPLRVFVRNLYGVTPVLEETQGDQEEV